MPCAQGEPVGSGVWCWVKPAGSIAMQMYNEPKEGAQEEVRPFLHTLQNSWIFLSTKAEWERWGAPDRAAGKSKGVYNRHELFGYSCPHKWHQGPLTAWGPHLGKFCSCQTCRSSAMYWQKIFWEEFRTVTMQGINVIPPLKMSSSNASLSWNPKETCYLDKVLIRAFCTIWFLRTFLKNQMSFNSAWVDNFKIRSLVTCIALTFFSGVSSNGLPSLGFQSCKLTTAVWLLLQVATEFSDCWIFNC